MYSLSCQTLLESLDSSGMTMDGGGGGALQHNNII